MNPVAYHIIRSVGGMIVVCIAYAHHVTHVTRPSKTADNTTSSQKIYANTFLSGLITQRCLHFHLNLEQRNLGEKILVYETLVCGLFEYDCFFDMLVYQTM